MYTRKTIPFALTLLTGFFGITSLAIAAPDIITQNLTGSGSFNIGSTVIFSGNVTNTGTAMDTTNAYRLIRTSFVLAVSPTMFDGIALSGTTFFTANSSNLGSTEVLSSYSVLNPLNPAHIGGFTDIAAGGSSVALSGNYAFRVSNNGKLMSFDVSTPSNPVKLQEITPVPMLNAQTITTSGGFAYTSANKQVIIFNVQNPSNMIKVGQFTTTGGDFISEITIVGSYAYVTTYSTKATLEIFDISNPAAPVQKSVTVFDGNAFGVTVQGTYAYIAKGPGTLGDTQILKIYDISNPASPIVVGGATVTGPGEGRRVALSGQYAYLMPNDSSIYVFNVSNPAAPVRVNQGYLVSASSNPDITLNSNYVYGNTMTRYSIFEPHTFGRFCVTNSAVFNSTEAANCLSSAGTGRIGGKDFDAGRLGAAGNYSTSTTWVATAGAHTIYYCSDVRDMSTGYEGVAESNEGNNCTSASFTVAPPPTVTTQAATNVFSGSGEMKAFVNSNGGGAITGWFRYDPVSSNLNCAADSGGTRAPVGSGSNFGAVGSTYYGNNVSSLTPATRYYYCAIASTPAGMSYGSILFFDTLPATRTVTPSAGSGGTLSPSTAQTVTYNNTIAFTVTPSAGYSIGSVTGCGGSLAGSTYTTGPITASCTVSATFTLLTGCANGRDALGNVLTLLSVDRTAAELNGKYRVTKFGGNYCFGNTSSSRYLIPLNTLAEFLSFWNNIGAGSNLPGLYRIP